MTEPSFEHCCAVAGKLTKKFTADVVEKECMCVCLWGNGGFKDQCCNKQELCMFNITKRIIAK